MRQRLKKSWSKLSKLMKRIKIRARGRADRIKKPFCNIEILLSEKLKKEKVEAKSGTES